MIAIKLVHINEGNWNEGDKSLVGTALQEYQHSFVSPLGDFRHFNEKPEMWHTRM